MKTAKTYMKIILLLTILLASSGLSGCGDFYLEGEHGWAVYQEREVIEHHSPAFFTRLVFELTWENDPAQEDLLVKVITPLGGRIIDDGFEIDHCFFLGTYADHTYLKSMIECIDPYFGVFELKVKNPSIWNIELAVAITQEYQIGYETHTDVYRTDITLLGHDKITLPFTY